MASAIGKGPGPGRRVEPARLRVPPQRLLVLGDDRGDLLDDLVGGRLDPAQPGLLVVDLALQIIEEVVRRPTISEVLRRADRRSRPTTLDADSVLDAVRAAREAG